jgi:arylsulfate sulfotransferase
MSLKSLSSYLVLFIIAYITGCNTGQTLPVTVSVSPSTAAVAPGQSIQFSATITNTVMGTMMPGTNKNDDTGIRWSAIGGSISNDGDFVASSDAASGTAYVIATSKKDHTKYANAVIHLVTQGQVSSTSNGQVASYSITPGAPANVSVQFGPDTNYGLTTWVQPSTKGQAINLLVAGMRANTQYHLRAVVQFNDGTQFVDGDQVFSTKGSDPTQAPAITASTAPGQIPQGGVELLDLASGVAWPTVADLSGNVLWSYSGVPNGTVANPIKLLPNGHFLMNFSEGTADGANSVLQEVDLTGQVIWQMTAADLNKALATATCSGCNITVVGTHHDFVQLPNGHLVVIAATQQDISGTTVVGDALIDLDQNRNPVWLWNEFDHLDTNRRPLNWPDWTHTNAILYSADDGNLVISVRHQNWLLKVDYENGKGNGNILWHLGYQGDFTLLGGTDPTDWFYAQHGPSFASPNTTGTFSMALFDNGDDRVFPSGVSCDTPDGPPCLYSTVPVLQIDETAMTATLTFHQTMPFYSFFGGNAELLANGNIEYCEAAGGASSNSGEIYEVMPSNTAQPVWQMQVAGQFAYRGQRIPSMYPGVQW